MVAGTGAGLVRPCGIAAKEPTAGVVAAWLTVPPGAGSVPRAEQGAERPLARKPPYLGCEPGIAALCSFVLPESSRKGGHERPAPLFEELLRVPRRNSQVGPTKAIQDRKIDANYFSIVIKKRPTRTS